MARGHLGKGRWQLLLTHPRSRLGRSGIAVTEVEAAAGEGASSPESSPKSASVGAGRGGIADVTNEGVRNAGGRGEVGSRPPQALRRGCMGRSLPTASAGARLGPRIQGALTSFAGWRRARCRVRRDGGGTERGKEDPALGSKARHARASQGAANGTIRTSMLRSREGEGRGPSVTPLSSTL